MPALARIGANETGGHSEQRPFNGACARANVRQQLYGIVSGFFLNTATLLIYRSFVKFGAAQRSSNLEW